jgi:predicted RNA-binding Zn-ribbon protein involved in translation (DUF1610 family)
MKNGTCPKCGSTEIFRIPGQRRTFENRESIRLGLTVFSNMMLTRYICVNCGFSEEWLDEPEDIWPD